MTVSQPSAAQSTNYYTLLGLPPPSNSVSLLSPQTIKRAYHRALLRHHPDKSHSNPSIPPSTSTPKEAPSIDDLTLAYTTLSSPSLRSTYDKSLFQSAHSVTKQPLS